MSVKTIRDHEGLGVIVTLSRRNDPQDTRSVHVAHRSRREALRRAVAPFDPAEWRVETIATPASVYADLTHSRPLVKETGSAPRGYSFRTRESNRGGSRVLAYSLGGVVLPEPYMLGAAGLKAYL